MNPADEPEANQTPTTEWATCVQDRAGRAVREAEVDPKSVLTETRWMARVGRVAPEEFREEPKGSTSTEVIERAQIDKGSGDNYSNASRKG
jgi:hypothetical protein